MNAIKHIREYLSKVLTNPRQRQSWEPQATESELLQFFILDSLIKIVSTLIFMVLLVSWITAIFASAALLPPWIGIPLAVMIASLGIGVLRFLGRDSYFI